MNVDQGTSIATRRTGWYASAVSFLALLLIALASGCGEEGDSGNVAAEESIPEITTETSAATDTEDPAAQAQRLDRLIEAEYEAHDGSTGRLVLEVGDLSRADELADLGVADACQVDLHRTAIVPGQVRIVNTTDGFDYQAAVGILWGAFPTRGDRHRFETADLRLASSERGCNSSDNANVTRTISVSPNGERTIDVAFVFQRFYSPRRPDGELAVLDRLHFALVPAGQELRCSSGHGVYRWYFSLSGRDIEKLQRRYGTLAEGKQAPPCR